ncbi:putative manganese transporter, partial [Amylibacter sp.]|nr:putative manganese transporter [Amylibacter sp.]
GMLIWATSSIKTMTNPKETTISRVSEETSFITAWVILAFLLFEYSTNIVGLDLQSWFETVGILVPLIAILIGFIPGCGPQILVTTFYINGLIPFAALIGNSIANDGDALFPAIAINPKIAIIATIYSSIPAVIVAYGFYFYIPNYLTP